MSLPTNRRKKNLQNNKASFSTADNNQYMSFGLSADPKHSVMVGGDIVVAWLDKQTLQGYAVDYFLDAKSQCSGGRGSCPDIKIQVQEACPPIFALLASNETHLSHTLERSFWGISLSGIILFSQRGRCIAFVYDLYCSLDG